MKITESTLKAIIKECLKEVLSEVLVEQQQQRTTSSQNPLINLIAAGVARGNPEQMKLYEGILTDAVQNNRDGDVIPIDAMNQLQQKPQPNQQHVAKDPKYPNRWAELAFNTSTSELGGLLASKMT